jgi:hypothetical protein
LGNRKPRRDARRQANELGIDVVDELGIDVVDELGVGAELVA